MPVNAKRGMANTNKTKTSKTFRDAITTRDIIRNTATHVDRDTTLSGCLDVAQ